MGKIHDNGSDPICSQLPAWHLPHSPTRRHNSYPAKGEANICSVQASCHGNQPDGKSLVRPSTTTVHTGLELGAGTMAGELPGERNAVVWGWEGKVGFICILIF